MKVFLAAGLLYLTGIAVILVVKPSLMFKEDGTWKEFGIGRDERRYTWLPLWMFCIMWALLSYIFAGLIVRAFGSDKGSVSVASVASISTEVPDLESIPKRRIRRGSSLPDGYYMLAKPTKPGETPTYVYLGDEA